LAGGDIEIFSDASAEDADEMIGVFAGQGGAVIGDFVGDPAAARHSLQLPVASGQLPDLNFA
jgi:hypothetical protein